MESEALNVKKTFKALAALIVFLISFSIPVLTSLAIQERARSMRIRMDMGQIRNWAEVYKLKNRTYKGLEKDASLKGAFENIESMDGEVVIFIGKKYDSYCAKVVFKKDSFCVDDSGYLGKDKGVCSSESASCN